MELNLGPGAEWYLTEEEAFGKIEEKGESAIEDIAMIRSTYDQWVGHREAQQDVNEEHTFAAFVSTVLGDVEAHDFDLEIEARTRWSTPRAPSRASARPAA